MFVLLNGCQIDQSVSLIKEKLFSDNENISNVDKESDKINNNKSDREIKTSKKSEKHKSTKIKENVEKNIVEKKRNVIPNELAFKEKGKARDTDSKIISFFTKIFDTEEENLTPSQLSKDNNENKIQSKTIEVIDEINKVETDKKLKLDYIKKTDIETINRNEIEPTEKIGSEDSISLKNNEDVTYENNDNQYIKEDEGNFAFLQLKGPKKKIEKKEIDNVVGLLLPLTGKKSAAGNLVINSLRYSMLLKPNQLNFKIFDTKGAPEGAIEAAKQGIKNGVKTFIGPIFSDETKEVKKYFDNKDDLIFFSLSPDLTNVSKNIIVSGQNPEEQVSCIIQKLAQNLSSKILVIHHSDKYGHVIKNSFSKFTKNFGVSRFASIEFFEMYEDMNLNDEIKKISRFDDRKRRLKNEIKKIKLDKSIDKELKKQQITNLERKLTLDTPFDSVIIASQGDALLEILSHLAFYDINSDNTDIYGTSLWEDTDKKDNVYEGTFYVTSLKDKNKEYIKNFKDVFSRDPLSLSFYIHDLIGLVQNLKVVNNDEIRNEVFYGEFSNSKIKSGLLQRQIYIRKIRKDEKTEEVSSCRLDEI